MNEIKRVAIIGGGISGLTAAFKLLKEARNSNSKIQVDLFEEKELGGVFKTVEDGEYRLECGPDSFFTKTPEILELSKELDISSNIIPTNEKKRKSLVAKGDQLIPLPEGFVMIAPSKEEAFMQTELLSENGKKRVMLEKELAPCENMTEESVAQFVERRFGAEMLAKIVQPMVGGIYTGDVNELSAEACLPEFVEMERTKGSIIKALLQRQKAGVDADAKGARYSAFFSFEKGMYHLIDALRQKIDQMGGLTFRINEKVSSIKKLDQGKWGLETVESESKAYDALILALPAASLARITASLDGIISQNASQIYCASSCVVNLIFNKSDIDQNMLDGFGFVVPEENQRPLIACSYLSEKYNHRSPEQKVILRAFFGGVKNEGILKESDAKLTELALEELAYYMKIKAKPLYSSISRWQESMPQYTIGHQGRIKAITKRLEDFPGIFITGNFISGVGIPKCVQMATEAAHNVAQFLQVQKAAQVN